MKSALSLALVSLLFTACYSPNNNCQAFKTGTFQYKTYANGELITSKIVRNDSLEIDYYNPQQPDTSKIRWINDCTYILTKYNPDNIRERQSFQMEIIETHEDRYTFLFSKVGEAKKKEFTATRMK